MEMMIALAVVALGGLAIFYVMASSKPDTFRVERQAVIAAPITKVFDQINDLHAWDAWSPWAKKDPNAKSNYSGPPAGKGAAFAWDGNNTVGKGRMEIIESEPSSKVVLRLDFEKPFKGTNQAAFTLAQVPGGTQVNWAMTGPANFASKVMDLLMNMDAMVGRDFEAGLQAMKSVCERR